LVYLIIYLFTILFAHHITGTVGAGNAYSLDLYFHKQVTEKDYDFVTVQDAEGSAGTRGRFRSLLV
jgi:hypothetical protein